MKDFLKKNIYQILVGLLSFIVLFPLFKSGYFSHQDDLQVIRIVEMRKCFSDFQIPCRWVPDMGWGNGYPLFNYYGVFTYYLGGLISFIFNYLVTAKILFGIALVLGSFGMYYFVSSYFKNNLAGFVSAVLYMFAPYKALDIYVRGALGEAMALTIIPFVFWFLYKIFEEPKSKKYFLFFVISLFFFLITHNIMTIVFLPFVLLFAVYLLFKNKFSNLKNLFFGFIISFLLSSFFLIPAFVEKDLVQTESLTRFELDFRANFVGFKQIFLDRSWGYGTSIPGPLGKMNFSAGTIHWIMAVLGSIFSPILGVIFLMSVFMMHNTSSFVWEAVPLLSYFQFPWRFLSLSIFISSILGGVFIYKLNKKYQLLGSVIIVIFTVIFNYSYFKPREYYLVTNEQKTSGELWEVQQKGALLDYLPKTALEPREKAVSNIEGLEIGSDYFKFNVNLDEKKEIEVPVFYFPNWAIYVNGVKIDIRHDNILGRIEFDLEKGGHEVVGKFKNTPIRNIANTLTLIGLVCFVIYIWKKY
jgi:hypothetical protein